MEFWIESIGYVNTPDECRISWHREEPQECTLSFVNRASGFSVSPNHHVYKVTVDDNKVVVSIYCDDYPKSVKGIYYIDYPTPETLVVGESLPDCLQEWLNQEK